MTFLLTWILIDCSANSKLRRENLMRRCWLTVAMGAIGPMLAVTAALGAPPDNISFSMVRSSAAVAAGCLPAASGRVTVHSLGPIEFMHVEVIGLPANKDFDFFVDPAPQ